MRYRALFAYGLLLAAGCGDRDVCSSSSETCLAVTLEGMDGVREVDQLALYIDGSRKNLKTAKSQVLPIQLPLFLLDGRHAIRLESFLQSVNNGTTEELTFDLSSGMHKRQTMTLRPMISPDADMARPSDMAKFIDLAM